MTPAIAIITPSGVKTLGFISLIGVDHEIYVKKTPVIMTITPKMMVITF
jgi:hypothetical protein